MRSKANIMAKEISNKIEESKIKKSYGNIRKPKEVEKIINNLMINSCNSNNSISTASSPTNEKKSENVEENIINNLIKVLEEIIRENENSKIKQKNSLFFLNSPPNISFSDYFGRIRKYIKIEFTSIIIALLYIDDITSETKNNLVLSINTIHKLFFSSLVLAIKYNEDDIDSNEYFAKVAGLKVSELNSLERNFCHLINFKFFVDEKKFSKYYEYLKKL